MSVAWASAGMNGLNSLHVDVAVRDSSFSSSGSGSSNPTVYFTPVSGLVVDPYRNPFLQSKCLSNISTELRSKEREKGSGEQKSGKERKRGRFVRLFSCFTGCGHKPNRRLSTRIFPEVATRDAITPSLGGNERPSPCVLRNLSVDAASKAKLAHQAGGKSKAEGMSGDACAGALLETRKMPERKRTFGLAAAESSKTPCTQPTDSENQAASGAEVDAMSLERLQRLNGVWKQDRSRSESYQGMCDVLELGWVFRKAIDNSDILELDINNRRIRQMARIFRLIDIVEEFSLGGDVSKLRRRDLRRGVLFGRTIVTSKGYKNVLWWDDPLKGGIKEEFQLSEDGRELTTLVSGWRESGGQFSFKVLWQRQVDGKCIGY